MSNLLNWACWGGGMKGSLDNRKNRATGWLTVGRGIHGGWFVIGLMLLAQWGCDGATSKISEELTRQFQASGRSFVNLAEVVPSVWDRVCILGPYSDDKAFKLTLGFDWPERSKASIGTNDGIALLLFLKDRQVLEWVEHSRQNGDFTNLSRQCFSKEEAHFEHLSNPPKGYPGLFPKKS